MTAPRARRLAVLVMAAAAIAPASAVADPILAPPLPGTARWEGPADDPWRLAFLAEARLLGVLAVDRLTVWPDRRLGTEPDRPVLVTARPGLVADLAAPVTFALRVDLGEPTRPWLDGPWGAIAAAFVDDAYVLFRPSRAAEVLVGRARVPFGHARRHEEADDPLGAPPFLVDRIAPDRRTGVGLHGDLGSLAYFAGAYADLDAVEPRLRLDDPSRGGAAALVAQLEWTPRAPMNGSNPPGRIPGATGPLPTPRADPWFGTARASLGAGALARLRRDGTRRLDATVALALKWRALALVAEPLVTRDGDETTWGAHAEVMATPVDPLALTARGEWDGGAGSAGEWAAWAGVTWHVRPDRRNKVGLVGWLRRDRARGTPADGLMVLLQASL